MPIAGKRFLRSFRCVFVVGKSPQFVLELIFCHKVPTNVEEVLIIGGTIFDKDGGLQVIFNIKHHL